LERGERGACARITGATRSPGFKAGDAKAINLMALDDPDLSPLFNAAE